MLLTAMLQKRYVANAVCCPSFMLLKHYVDTKALCCPSAASCARIYMTMGKKKDDRYDSEKKMKKNDMTMKRKKTARCKPRADLLPASSAQKTEEMKKDDMTMKKKSSTMRAATGSIACISCPRCPLVRVGAAGVAGAAGATVS